MVRRGKARRARGRCHFHAPPGPPGREAPRARARGDDDAYAFRARSPPRWRRPRRPRGTTGAEGRHRPSRRSLCPSRGECRFRTAAARARTTAQALRKSLSVRGPEAAGSISPLRFQSRARPRRFKSRGFVNPEIFPICRARWRAHATIRAASISRGARRVQPNGVSGSGCGPARCPPATMATPPVTVKEVVSVRARALARRPNPRRAIFRSGVSGCLLGAPNPSSPHRAPSAAHERRHQPAMHLFHQPHDGEREVHLRARDGRVQQRGHRRHGQPAAADEEVRE